MSTRPKRHRPGSSWRVLSNGPRGARVDVRDLGEFDEVVVDRWLHVERMGRGQWWMQVGEHTLIVDVGPDGQAAKVTYHPPGTY